MLNASARCELADQWKRRRVNVQSSLRAKYQNENKGRRPVIRGFTTKRTQENGISLWERIEIDSREIRGVLSVVCFVFHTWKHFEESQGYVYHANGWKVMARVEK